MIEYAGTRERFRKVVGLTASERVDDEGEELRVRVKGSGMVKESPKSFVKKI